MWQKSAPPTSQSWLSHGQLKGNLTQVAPLLRIIALPIRPRHVAKVRPRLACRLRPLQGRARTVGQVLLGWYEIPSQMGQPVDIIVNPAGLEERSRLRCRAFVTYDPPKPSLRSPAAGHAQPCAIVKLSPRCSGLMQARVILAEGVSRLLGVRCCAPLCSSKAGLAAVVKHISGKCCGAGAFTAMPLSQSILLRTWLRNTPPASNPCHIVQGLEPRRRPGQADRAGAKPGRRPRACRRPPGRRRSRACQVRRPSAACTADEPRKTPAHSAVTRAQMHR